MILQNLQTLHGSSKHAKYNKKIETLKNYNQKRKAFNYLFRFVHRLQKTYRKIKA